jgi:hypothetical protein
VQTSDVVEKSCQGPTTLAYFPFYENISIIFINDLNTLAYFAKEKKMQNRIVLSVVYKVGETEGHSYRGNKITEERRDRGKERPREGKAEEGGDKGISDTEGRRDRGKGDTKVQRYRGKGRQGNIRGGK